MALSSRSCLWRLQHTVGGAGAPLSPSGIYTIGRHYAVAEDSKRRIYLRFAELRQANILGHPSFLGRNAPIDWWHRDRNKPDLEFFNPGRRVPSSWFLHFTIQVGTHLLTSSVSPISKDSSQ